MTDSDHIRVSADNTRVNITVDGELVIFSHPLLNSGEPIFDQVLAFFRSQAEPWIYDTLFDQRNYFGFTPFETIETFAVTWYEIVQKKDAGRRVATVARIDDVLQIDRYQGAYQALFPSREFRLFQDYDEAHAWITRPR